MKKRINEKKAKCILAAVISLLMLFAIMPMSAFAWTSEEGTTCTSSFGSYYVGSDGSYYYGKKDANVLLYDANGNTSTSIYGYGSPGIKYLLTNSNGTHQVYCVESGVDFYTGSNYLSKNGTNSSYFQNLPMEAQFGIMMALMYGWYEGKTSPVAGTNIDDYAYATQQIIWEYQQQIRTSPSSLVSNHGIAADTYYSTLKGRPAEKCYDWILSQMANHYTIPSFAARSISAAPTHTLKYDPNT
ncbi:MAG: Cys-Gln thioester bond-forming surface protein, partial [Clostridiales bacterium]|nr:Cys-Gln thioester bond-forming surface protein [Clostridiales bacterium]